MNKQKPVEKQPVSVQEVLDKIVTPKRKPKKFLRDGVDGSNLLLLLMQEVKTYQ